ncbi:MAG: 50S ribosome-binding GTPase [Planctomycetes bacterium]|nr:50S ribosome-binding GTPase [Planctomycetota bacterium]
MKTVFEDTIIAISSPLGTSAQAVIRLSGPHVIERVAAITRLDSGITLQELPGFHQETGAIDWEGVPVPARVAVFRRPRSFTGEDLVEATVPGSLPILDGLVRQFLTAAPAAASPAAGSIRLARPGEFTLRAFLNGRLQLSQAEAVGRLIHASGAAEARAAYRQLGGDFTRRLEAAERALTELLALVEAGIDFADEDLPAIAPAVLSGQARSARSALEELLRSAALRLPERGHWRIALLGKPNAGKSSLVNALAGRPVALVSEWAGTTRDPVRAVTRHGDRQLEWVDLAGLEESSWSLERLLQGGEPAGSAALQRISERELATADAALWVVDGADAAGREAARQGFSELCQAAAFQDLVKVLIAAKADLLSAAEKEEWAALPERPALTSARTGEGLEELLDRIIEGARRREASPGAAGSAPPLESAFLVSPAEHARLVECRDILDRVESRLREGSGHELAAVDLRDALQRLAPLTGRELSEKVLGEIFGRFCIGK